MATIVPTTVNLPINGADGKCRVVTWTPLITANAVGEGVLFPQATKLEVQITGTFGTGTVAIQGSLDNANWFTLTNKQGTAIARTSASLDTIQNRPLYIRPLATGTDGTTSITVILLMSA